MLKKWIKPISAIIREAFNKDARKIKGLIGDLKSFSYRDKNFIAGIDSVSFWGGLYISSLFVDENYRNQNYGSLLIEKAENMVLSHLLYCAINATEPK